MSNDLVVRVGEVDSIQSALKRAIERRAEQLVTEAVAELRRSAFAYVEQITAEVLRVPTSGDIEIKIKAPLLQTVRYGGKK